ncbi:MAG TPA: hypothetical protein VLI04_14010 [Nocardioidaceae bacterium]|nr:hypothetical protein [Nocardioidaceae bacterium]
MNQQLHDLLHDIGDEQEAVYVEPATYARGRRAQRRSVITAVALGVAALAALAAGVSAMPLSDRANDPVGDPDHPALPSRVYAVPEGLVNFHEYGSVWDESVRANSLAIGPTSLVFPVSTDAVMAVSATDGSYRGLDLPGFDGDAFLRFMDAVVALSPDGTRLAYTWNPSVMTNEPLGTPARSGIRVANLETGEVESLAMPSEFGVFAHGLAWSPNSRYLAYNLWTSTTAAGSIRGARNFTVERLDLSTGDRVQVDLTSGEVAPAVSSKGEVAVIGDGVRTWLPGRSPEIRLAHPARIAHTATWSPDGRLATGASDSNRPYVVRAGLPGDMSPRPLPADIDRQTSTRVVAWIGDEVAVLRHTDRGSEVTAIGPSGESRTMITGIRADGYGHVSIATGLLSEPTRDFSQPDWPFDWSQPRIWLGALGLLALLWIAGTFVGRRRELRGQW